MRVQVVSTFLHGAERFEAGALLTDEADAPAEYRHRHTDELAYFVAAGWARDLSTVTADASQGAEAEIAVLTFHPPKEGEVIQFDDSTTGVLSSAA